MGKLPGKVGLVLNTANTPQEREDGDFRDPLASIWERWLNEAGQAVVDVVGRAESKNSARIPGV